MQFQPVLYNRTNSPNSERIPYREALLKVQAVTPFVYQFDRKSGRLIYLSLVPLFHAFTKGPYYE